MLDNSPCDGNSIRKKAHPEFIPFQVVVSELKQGYTEAATLSNACPLTLGPNPACPASTCHVSTWNTVGHGRRMEDQDGSKRKGATWHEGNQQEGAVNKK
jgi:hypothetical protein